MSKIKSHNERWDFRERERRITVLMEDIAKLDKLELTPLKKILEEIVDIIEDTHLHIQRLQGIKSDRY